MALVESALDALEGPSRRPSRLLGQGPGTRFPVDAHDDDCSTRAAWLVACPRQQCVLQEAPHLPGTSPGDETVSCLCFMRVPDQHAFGACRNARLSWVVR